METLSNRPQAVACINHSVAFVGSSKRLAKQLESTDHCGTPLAPSYTRDSVDSSGAMTDVYPPSTSSIPVLPSAHLALAASICSLSIIAHKIQYSEFWCQKLAKNEGGVRLFNELFEAVAGIADGFSFPYLEVFVASLLKLVTTNGDVCAAGSRGALDEEGDQEAGKGLEEGAGGGD